MESGSAKVDPTEEDGTTAPSQGGGGLPDEVLRKIVAASCGTRHEMEGTAGCTADRIAAIHDTELGQLSEEDTTKIANDAPPTAAAAITTTTTPTPTVVDQKRIAMGPPAREDASTEVPKPPPLRSSHEIQSLPGAYSERGIGGDTSRVQYRDQGNNTILSARVPNRQEEDTETPIAQQVEDGEAQDLPHATPHSSRNRNRPSEDRHSYILTGIILVGAVGVVVLILVLGLVLTRDTAQNDLNNTAAPLWNASTADPLSADEFLLSVLPQHSVKAITGEPESPQALAFQWLLNDTDLYTGSGSNTKILTHWRIQQRYALATLYYATEGHLWFHNENWLNHSSHECSWYSEIRNRLFQPPPLLCPDFNSSDTEAMGVITNLGLTRNNLIGSLPLELMMLTSLRTLSLGLNVQLQGPIPNAIGNLTNLEGLWIHNVQNGGTIPSSIGMLTKLRAISLAGNDHEGSIPNQLVQLTNTESLLLGSNPRLTGNIHPINTMKKLRFLSLDRNDHTGILFVV